MKLDSSILLPSPRSPGDIYYSHLRIYIFSSKEQRRARGESITAVAAASTTPYFLLAQAGLSVRESGMFLY